MNDLRELSDLLRRGFLWYRHRGLSSTWKRVTGLRGDRRAPSSRSYTSWLLHEPDDRPSAPPLLLSVLVPVLDPLPALLEALWESVRDQDHAAWELLLADDGCRDPAVLALLAELPRRDARVRRIAAPEGAHGISAATNAAAAAARGEALLLADHDDRLARGVLARVAAAFASDAALECAYTDEDQLAPWGQRVQPVFKPGPSPMLLLGFNYVTHLLALRRALWEQLGGLRAEFDGSQDHDLALRAFEGARRIAHLPGIGYHWRRVPGSVADSSTAKPWAYAAGQRAVAAACARRGLPLEVTAGPVPGVSVLTPRALAQPLRAHVVLRGPERGCAAWSALLAPLQASPHAPPPAGSARPEAPLVVLGITRNAWPALASTSGDAAGDAESGPRAGAGTRVGADAWLVIDATLEPSLAPLAVLLPWLGVPGVGGATAAGCAGRRRRDLGWSVARDGLAQPIAPGLPVHSAGPGLLASGVREVATALAGLTCVLAPPPALRAALANRPVSVADALCLALSPYTRGACTLFVPACQPREARAARLPRGDAGPARDGASPVNLAESAAWTALRAALAADFWSGGADRFCPRHELLAELGLPAPVSTPPVGAPPQSSRSTTA